jgi:hypothetical protein
MAKSIYLTDEQYKQITEAARKSGFRVQRGRGSQLALFIVAAANNACTLTGGILPPEKPLSTSKQLPRSRKLSKPATRR